MLKLPNSLREELKKPFGDVYRDIPLLNGDIITVGDVVTKTLIEKNIIPKLAIIDFKTKRNIPIKINHKFDKVYYIKNPPGYISDEAIEKVKYLSNKSIKNYAIVVDGEEDLLTLIVIKYFPEGDYVLYGLPDEGVVVMKIDKNIKNKVDNILKKFEKVSK
ncbi:GTP-dependent dephospho-CoA kinase family protein [Methanocaldococcus indicus]|uniref:GTP-dependent dephospho-CoA kinase family protein n=1 Tax=Methanocaldococcus indicus TaxID=213231 RepID=UPI003C6D496C